MPLYKVVILGDGGVGKSCLTIQFTQNHFVREYDPTIENSYRKQITVDDEACILDILDTAGQEEYSVMQDQYIHSGEGFICVYSITSRTSFDAITDLRQKIMQVKDTESYPMTIIANKCDLEKQRVVSHEEGKALAKKWGISFVEASAKSRLNVDEAFHSIAMEIRRMTQENKSNRSPSSKPKKSGCTIL